MLSEAFINNFTTDASSLAFSESLKHKSLALYEELTPPDNFFYDFTHIQECFLEVFTLEIFNNCTIHPSLVTLSTLAIDSLPAIFRNCSLQRQLKSTL